MAGTIHGVLECLFRQDTVAHATQETFTRIYSFLKTYKTLETLQYGLLGTGDGYWDDVNPVGLSGHFLDNAFAVFKFPAAGSRDWYWQLMLQYGYSSNFGTAPGDPGLLLGNSFTTGVGISAAVGIDGSNVEFDPWLGGKKTDGKARKVPAWNVGQTYNLGDRVIYNGVGYESLTNGNIGSTPPSVQWTTWMAAPSAWSASTAYNVGDKVFYTTNNTTYVSIVNGNYNRLPTNTSWWLPWTSAVWGTPPGVSGGSVYALPRSNSLLLGAHGVQKHNAGTITSGTAGATNMSFMHIFCDDDALLILFSEGAGTQPSCSFVYVGPYTPLHGHKPKRPLIMIGCRGDSKSADICAQIYGDTAGSSTNFGGVITQSHGVRSVSFDRLNTIQGDTAYEPNWLDSPIEYGEYPLIVRAAEIVGSDALSLYRGMIGKIDSPLFRLALGNIFGRYSISKRRVLLGSGFGTSSTGATRFTVPWDGVTMVGSGSSRYGVVYNP